MIRKGARSHTGGGTGSGGPGRRSRKRTRWLPFLLLAVIAAFILMREVPEIGLLVEDVLAPAKATARAACHDAALAQAAQPDFARVIQAGKVVPTRNGLLIEDVIVGEMGPEGKELRVRVSCYVDTAGAVINVHRSPIR